MNTQPTQRFVSYTALPLSASYRSTMQLGSTQRFVSDNDSSACRNSTLLDLPHRFATSLNATQQFVSNVAPFRSASPRSATQRTSSQLNDLLVTTLRLVTPLCAPLLASSQLNDLLVTLLRFSLLRTALLHYAPQLNVIAKM